MSRSEIERWSRFKVWLYSLFSHGEERNRLSVDRLGLQPADRFLDLGCGLGEALSHAASITTEVSGIDPSPTMVERAGRRVPEATVLIGSAESIPFPDVSFTAVLAVATLHHWTDRTRGLGEVRRILAPGGRFLIVEKQLDRGDGHGLSPAEADAVIRDLIHHGFVSGARESFDADGTRYVAILALG